ncbi:MAG: helix-turn-helix transcriptional regulator [Candidatus Competibacteraceae bacterium]|nr:helix-turn-helix transcriptional regulator [Candidatus Competibacteraceae bacterium]
MKNHKGQRLKVARKAAGLSQKQLGERLNVDQAFLSRVEKGLNDGTVTFWCDVARQLDVSLDTLLMEEPRPQHLGEPRRMNKLAILADYSAPAGLRALALDGTLVDALQISDAEWTQLAAVPLAPSVSKTGYLQLLISLRSIQPPASDHVATPD